MSHIIQVDFLNNQLQRPLSDNQSIQSQADSMLETLSLYNIHFWANECKANRKLTHKQCREFGNKLRDLRIRINSLVHEYNEHNNKTLCEKLLNHNQKHEFNEIIQWFEELDIPFVQNNVIEIEQFLKESK